MTEYLLIGLKRGMSGTPRPSTISDRL